MQWTDKDDPRLISARLWRFNRLHSSWDAGIQQRRRLPNWALCRERELWHRITETPAIQCGD